MSHIEIPSTRFVSVLILHVLLATGVKCFWLCGLLRCEQCSITTGRRFNASRKIDRYILTVAKILARIVKKRTLRVWSQKTRGLNSMSTLLLRPKFFTKV